MKRPILRVILLALLAVAAAAPARAFTNKLQYTGKILDATGATVGSVSSIKLDVFSDTTTAAIWSNTYATVPLDAGRFSIDLDLTPVSAAPLLAAVDAGNDLWLRTTFTPTGGSAVVMPFQRFAPVAYAVTAGSTPTSPGEVDNSGAGPVDQSPTNNFSGSSAKSLGNLTLTAPAPGWIVVEGIATADVVGPSAPIATSLMITTAADLAVVTTTGGASGVQFASLPAGAGLHRDGTAHTTTLACRAVFHVTAAGSNTYHLTTNTLWDGGNNTATVKYYSYELVARYYDRQY